MGIHSGTIGRALPALLLCTAALADEPSLEQRTDAAQTTAATNAYCTAVTPFYWEIGDAQQGLASGAVGNGAPVATTQMLIASASKWLFGAYVVQRAQGQPSETEIQALNMGSGYHDLSYIGCLRTRDVAQRRETVEECLTTANNATYDPDSVGYFYYNGGHFQKLAADDLGMGPMVNRTLGNELGRVLGTDFSILYDSPQLAAGVATTAKDYAVFLRKLMNGSLLLGAQLGKHAVCTNPATCPTALSTPIPADESWSYALGYWVEDDPVVGDGAYSSAGAFGFYPWISQDQQWYGVLARESDSGSGTESAYCGRLIRKAWVEGVAQ